MIDKFLGLQEQDLLKENWLTRDDSLVNYHCDQCEKTIQYPISKRVPDEVKQSYIQLCACGGEYYYKNTESTKISMMVKTTFEKNGRPAVRTTFANGSSIVRSQTKENALKGKGTKSVLTRPHQESVDKEKDIIVRNQAEQVHKYMEKSVYENKRNSRKKSSNN